MEDHHHKRAGSVSVSLSDSANTSLREHRVGSSIVSETGEWVPGYQHLSDRTFRERIDRLWESYEACNLCARACGVDRTAGETGICQADDTVLVSSAAPHHGEEACLTGRHGSGTIFLSNCNLKCVFCQNYELSHYGRGSSSSVQEIAEMALALQAAGCHNINFVSPTHYTPHLVEAVYRAAQAGLRVPIVWNCGGYEDVDTLALLESIVDIYMPDAKWADDEASTTYSAAPGYWDVNKAALREMHRQVGDLVCDDGIARRGLLIRHLVMPGHIESSKRVMAFIAEELSTDSFVNIMAQYRPAFKARTESTYEAINRPVRPAEYDAVVEHARSLGLDRLDINRPARGWLSR